MNKKQKKMIMDEVGAYHDIVSDYKDIFTEINNILDYSIPKEQFILDGLQSITDGFEEEINESLSLIHKIQEVK
jgi:hypothetical protein|tara:strand:+ start:1514 stop:1735 length:222 start_codon:yes stop_codon:yes gene_type:complete